MTGRYITAWVCVLALILFAILFFFSAKDLYACETVPITGNTPTGIAGCEVWGEGTASHYGFGSGVAMNFCTWTLRHSTGCGMVSIQSHQTGLVVTVPVVDFCDCWLGDNDPNNDRIVDLQYNVVAALGLDLAQGLYPVTVWREQVAPVVTPQTGSGGSSSVPNTALPPAGFGQGPRRGTATVASDSPTGLFELIGSLGCCYGVSPRLE